ncbi:MAG: thioesterase domain-containing protein, partial [Tumebacillaceae bacterium]
GELFIGGAGLARGYLNRPELTAEKFIPHPFDQTPGARLYRTGDLARYLSNGSIEYLSRVDHQVKLRGYRMELGEIEAVLEQHPSVSEAVVVIREDVPGDKQLVAYLVEASDATVSFAEMRRHLLVKLPEYMVPSIYVVLEELPLTPNGKVDRKNLPAPDGARHAQGENYVPPRDLVELEMAKIWEEILLVKPIGAFDNFFALGGNSLKALALMGAIRKRFDLELPLTALFRTPTIAEICDYFRGNTTLAPEVLVPIQQGEGDRTPLFLVHPHGGGVLSYFHLARTLGREETVFGLQAVGYESEESPLNSITEQADRYVEEIKRVAPHGPYRLAGWSFGGMVAYEMARRLETAGEQVEFLGLIDVHPFGLEDEMHFDSIPLEEPELVQYAVILGLDEANIATLSEADAHALLLRQAKELKLLPDIARVETMWGKLQVILAHSVAMTNYRSVGTISSDIHLFCASEISEVTGHALVDAELWHKRTAGQVHVTQLPGDHTSILEPPHVAVLAEHIKTTNSREAVVPPSVNATI